MQQTTNGNDFLINEMVEEMVTSLTKKLALAMFGLAVIQIVAMALLIRL